MPTTVISQRLRMSKNRENERELNIYVCVCAVCYRPGHNFPIIKIPSVHQLHGFCLKRTSSGLDGANIQIDMPDVDHEFTVLMR